MNKTLLTSVLLLSMSLSASAQESPLWLRRNAISPDATQIAFTYKGDIYLVDAEGGRARQLTTNQAYDSNPMWTPDGKEIVFSSYRELGKDIYKVSAEGRVPQRLTSHPGSETPMAVMDDGSILFSASIQQDAQYGDFPDGSQVYAIGPDGGRPKQVTSLPISNISIGPDNIVIYEDYKGYEDPWRKHHTSSVTHDIWIYEPSEDKLADPISINGNGVFTKLTTFKGEDRNPVFTADGDSFYYLSEQDGTFNVYFSGSLRNNNGKIKPEQLTFYRSHEYIASQHDCYFLSVR